jgi:predicted nucleic acid-binding protein
MTSSMVVDSSLSLKWFFKDEKEADYALTFLEDFANHRIEIIVPTIWLYEMANGVRTAVLQNRISFKKGINLINQLIKILPRFEDFEPLLKEAFVLAKQFELSIYDGSYLACAKTKKLQFFTGDKKLYNKVKKEFDWVKSISKYPPT